MSTTDDQNAPVAQESTGESNNQQRLGVEDTINPQQRERIAAALGAGGDIADRALELGFDAQTARVLPLVPLIQMAWIDGSVSDEERSAVVEFARRFGVAKETPAMRFLMLLLDERPGEFFFRRVNNLIFDLIESRPDVWRGETLVDLCEEIADASGGFFGITSSIDGDERALLQEFAELFSLENKTTADLPDIS